MEEGGTYNVGFDEQTAVVDFVWWNRTTCQSSQLVPYLTVAPQYGVVQYSFGTATVTSAPCTGTVVPVTIVYYTWNVHTSVSLFDSFVINATDPLGDQFYWNATTELLAKGDGDCCKSPGGVGLGDPISIGTGNVFEKVVDYETVGQNKLRYVRYYNSIPVPNAFASTLGQLWRSNYDRYLLFFSGGSLIVAGRPDGQQINFYNNSGSWVSDSDADYTLAQSGNTWALKDHDDTVETYTELSTGEGLLNSIALRNGYTRTMSYIPATNSRRLRTPTTAS